MDRSEDFDMLPLDKNGTSFGSVSCRLASPELSQKLTPKIQREDVGILENVNEANNCRR